MQKETYVAPELQKQEPLRDITASGSSSWVKTASTY